MTAVLCERERQRKTHGWRLFDDLLMSSLYTAVSLKQVDIVAMLVTEYLHLYMPADKQLTSSTLASFFFFLLWSGICSLRMPALRPAPQAGPMSNPTKGISVVLHDTIRLT